MSVCNDRPFLSRVQCPIEGCKKWYPPGGPYKWHLDQKHDLDYITPQREMRGNAPNLDLDDGNHGSEASSSDSLSPHAAIFDNDPVEPTGNTAADHPDFLEYFDTSLWLSSPPLDLPQGMALGNLRDVTMDYDESAANHADFMDVSTDFEIQFDEASLSPEPTASRVKPPQTRNYHPTLTADFLYRESQMPEKKIKKLISLWEASFCQRQSTAGHVPFQSLKEMYGSIDRIPHGDLDWQSFTINYPQSDETGAEHLSWMAQKFEVWHHDVLKVIEGILSNPDFDGEFDYSPYQEYINGEHCFQNVMSGNWAWRQADKIVEDHPDAEGAMFVPIILGSDKTTVLVGTGNNEYYPLYLSIGNIHNSARCEHQNGLILLGFLAIPKVEKEFKDDATFCKFSRQLIHSALSQILMPLKPFMTKPRVVRCPDQRYYKAIFGLGPYIGDYPEQCLIACIVQGWCPKCITRLSGKNILHTSRAPRSLEHTVQALETYELAKLWKEYGLIGDVIPFAEDFPCANIYELITPDILRQLVKGTFKDHLVTWVEEYITRHNPDGRNTEKILDDINQRIAAVPHFNGLRQFPKGRGFKQWTGDDSKALMKVQLLVSLPDSMPLIPKLPLKVYVPTLEGYVLQEIIRTLIAFLDFCYVVCKGSITTSDLIQLQDALDQFCSNKMIFMTSGIRTEVLVTPPHQHSMEHYEFMIQSKHIKAVKEPWRRSNRHNPLQQMIKSNTRMDKLIAAHVHYQSWGMLSSSLMDDLSSSDDEDFANVVGEGKDDDEGDDDDEGGSGTPLDGRHVSASDLARQLKQPRFAQLLSEYMTLHSEMPEFNVVNSFPPETCEAISFSTHSSAVASFYSVSDSVSIHTERVRATQSWQNGPGCYDTVFVKEAPEADSISSGLTIAQVRLFFSFSFGGKSHSCAYLSDYTLHPLRDPNFRLWIVKRGHHPETRILPINRILRAAHLIPVYGNTKVSKNHTILQTLDKYTKFYVNKYVDYHSFQIAS
ncbi:hypothetical protein NP233_g8618 [Leucocoprinus birnbaumii]|uniref:C2H2-type domain-containing protein n=1 Tax=Leucocoprinus birnbaumii TaxID=56174 RepID=A0AAD5VSG4_9AGAR|nr:hypothetical protein NP233_g8618 [Leucocoprinus birnbaumii]